MPGHLAQIEALDNKVTAAVQTAMRMEVRRLTQRAARWFLQNRRHPLDIGAQIEHFREGIRDLSAHLPKLLQGPHLLRYQEQREDLIIAGVPGDLASSIAGMPSLFGGLDIVETAAAAGRPVLDVAEVYFDLADRMDIAVIQQRIVDLPRNDRLVDHGPRRAARRALRRARRAHRRAAGRRRPGGHAGAALRGLAGPGPRGGGALAGRADGDPLVRGLRSGDAVGRDADDQRDTAGDGDVSDGAGAEGSVPDRDEGRDA